MAKTHYVAQESSYRNLEQRYNLPRSGWPTFIPRHMHYQATENAIKLICRAPLVSVTVDFSAKIKTNATHNATLRCSYPIWDLIVVVQLARFTHVHSTFKTQQGRHNWLYSKMIKLLK